MAVIAASLSALDLSSQLSGVGQTASEESGFPIGILVILIFVYFSGAVMGTLVTTCWHRHIPRRREPEVPRAPPPPPPVPFPTTREVKVVVPPSVILVGTTPACHRYHDVDSFDSNCTAIEGVVERNPNCLVTKRFTPCEKCYPKAARVDSRVFRQRQFQDNVPLQVD